MKHDLLAIIAVPKDLLKGSFVILTTPKLLMLCMVPYLIGLAVLLLCIVAAFWFRRDLAALLMPEPGWLQAGASWLLFLVNAFISVFIALLAALGLGAFFIESFIVEVLKRFQIAVPADEHLLSMVKSTLRGLRDDLVRAAVILALALLSLLAGIVPFLALVPLLLLCFTAGYNMFDLPLALLQIRFKDRWSLVQRHLPETIVLGACFSLILLIPLGGIVLLPVAYYAAIARIAGWPRQEIMPTPLRESRLKP